MSPTNKIGGVARCHDAPKFLDTSGVMSLVTLLSNVLGSDLVERKKHMDSRGSFFYLQLEGICMEYKKF